MFGIDWGDQQTLWLNVTNAALGLVVVAAIALLTSGAIYDLARKWLRRGAAENVAHTYFDPQLGLTMADGGEPEKPKAAPGKGKAGKRG